MHAWIINVVWIVYSRTNWDFDVVYQLYIIVYENKGILVIIDKYFIDYSLRSVAILYAQALAFLPDHSGKRKSSKYRQK